MSKPSTQTQVSTKAFQNINLQYSQQSIKQNPHTKAQKVKQCNDNNNGQLEFNQKKKSIPEQKKLPIIYSKGKPIDSPLKQIKKQKITTVYENLDEFQKRRIKSEQFSILKKIQETLNNGNRSFNRILKYEDGYTYEGDFQESKDEIILEGQGVLKYNNEIIYEGQFRNNKFHGNGILKQDNKVYNLIDWRRKDQSEIKGIFEDGILIGEQTMVN